MENTLNKIEFRIEGHIFRWTVIDTHIVNEKKYALMESSIGDEAPLILVEVDTKKIKYKDFTIKRTGEVIRLPVIPEELVIDDEVYDDIMIALEDNNIL